MSAGMFTDTVYVTDGGLVTSIRVQPETITPFNAIGAGTILPGTPSARVSGGKRKIGISARIARFRWVAPAPTGYLQNGVITLPIFTKAAYEALVKNVSYPYLGTGLRFIGKTPEVVK